MIVDLLLDKLKLELAIKGVSGKQYSLFFASMVSPVSANNHAKINQRGFHDWWVLVYNDEKAKVSYFSFLDLGIGVFKTLPKKISQKVVETIMHKPDMNLELLKKLIKGELESRTKKKFRGKGFPLIIKNSKSKYIKNFSFVLKK